MTQFNYNLGAQEDFDNMTNEMGRTVKVLTREESLTYDGQEGEDKGVTGSPMTSKGLGRDEIVFYQELDSQNEAVAAGIMQIGDVRFNFLSDSIVEEEAYIITEDAIYKVLELTKYRNMPNNTITDIRAFGKKMPNR